VVEGSGLDAFNFGARSGRMVVVPTNYTCLFLKTLAENAEV